MSFKINAKQFLLTYPKCTLSKEEVLENLQVSHKVCEYTICEERHLDGSPHVHAVITLSDRLHTTNARCFDLGLWHPNIKVLKKKKDLEEARNYVRKDGKFITNFQELIGKRLALAQAILSEGRITKKLIFERPEVIFLNYSSISQWLNHCKKPIETVPPELKRRHLWLTGPSNCGKTYFLRAYLSLYTNTSEIPDNQDHRDFTEATEVCWVDEYRGQHTVQYLNKLCDGNTQLNTKGGSTRIAYPTVIVCSNFTIRETYPKIQDKIYETLTNRFQQYDLSFKRPPFPYSIINK